MNYKYTLNPFYANYFFPWSVTNKLDFMHSKPEEDTPDLNYDKFSVHKILCPCATALCSVHRSHIIRISTYEPCINRAPKNTADYYEHRAYIEPWIIELPLKCPCSRHRRTNTPETLGISRASHWTRTNPTNFFHLTYSMVLIQY